MKESINKCDKTPQKHHGGEREMKKGERQQQETEKDQERKKSIEKGM